MVGTSNFASWVMAIDRVIHHAELHTATSSGEVYSMISVQRLEQWIVPRRPAMQRVAIEVENHQLVKITNWVGFSVAVVWLVNYWI